MSGITFFVPGVPVPKGSAKGFVVKSKQTGKHRAIITQDNNEKQKPWASSISFTAKMYFGNRPLILGPVCVGLQFVMPRLKGHYGSGKNATSVKESAPTWHTSKPDLDKLTRCVWDALTGVVWKDDSQVCLMNPPPRKMYGNSPGVKITIEEL